MRVVNGLRKGLVTSLALNAALVATQSKAEEHTSSEASIWGDSTDVTLGMAASYAPRYPGSKNFNTTLQPSLHIERGIFFADSEEGLGLQWQSNSGFSGSASLGYDYGRADGDSDYRYGSDKLKGMGEVGGATVLNLNASQEILPWLSINAKAELRTGGEKRGNRYRLGLETTLYNSDHDTVSWNVDAHAGDGKFNQIYFGVTPEQSASSRYSAFKADSGIFAYSTELSWQHTFDDHWSTVAGVELMHFTDQVRNSPLITKDSSPTSYVGVNYKF
ncbi:MipA/OmpV family protein [Pseudomonas sp. BGr12]|uniref:MipA/OmpV family protein n=1 Tax=Pseudomonas sp. BGr12 TaxID=2936269 RepID=UPI002559928C|nr:MipA/OmpV family protein [Pseudomonas sp. BJa5]MDL2426306.1 MipA/OmpV family protein [Pseudomonas sp. BJa5]